MLKGVKKQAHPQGQMFTRTQNRRTSVLTYSLSDSLNILSHTSLQGRSFYFYISFQLLETVVEYDGIHICLFLACSHYTSPSWGLKTSFRKEEAAWMKQNAQREIKRCHMEGLIGVVGNKAYSVGDCVSAVESSTRNCPCTNVMSNLITSVVHY
jgi:hypothetical protein